jgi:hypothetical protein
MFDWYSFVIELASDFPEGGKQKEKKKIINI